MAFQCPDVAASYADCEADVFGRRIGQRFRDGYIDESGLDEAVTDFVRGADALYTLSMSERVELRYSALAAAAEVEEHGL